MVMQHPELTPKVSTPIHRDLRGLGLLTDAPEPKNYPSLVEVVGPAKQQDLTAKASY